MSQRITSILRLLEGSHVRQAINAMIASIDGVSDADAAALREATDVRLHGLYSSLEDVCIDDDMTEAEAMLPWMCFELRFEWMRLNSQMQYQTVMQGTADPVLMARGAVLSYLIEEMERQLDTAQLFAVSRITSDFSGVAMAAINRTDRLFDVMAAASTGGRDAVESLLTAQEKIARLSSSGPVRQEMTEAIGTVMQNVGDALRVTSEDFSHALQGVVLRQLGNAPVLVILDQDNAGTTTHLPSAVANGMLRVASEWMAALAATGITASATERIEQGRPAFITLRWKLTDAGQQVSLDLLDDADGTVVFTPDPRVWPIRDFRLSLSQQPGQGSHLHIECDVTRIADYLILEVGPQAGDLLVAVPSLNVVHIEQRDDTALGVHGTRLINRHSGSSHLLLDLGEILFGTPNPSNGATYIHLRHTYGNEDVVALRVRSIQRICRGIVKPVPTMLRGIPMHGFIIAGQDIVGSLDIAQVLQLHQEMCQQEATQADDADMDLDTAVAAA